MATNSVDQVTPSSHNSGRSDDSQITQQSCSTTAITPREGHDHPPSSIAVVQHPVFQHNMIPPGNSHLDSGFDSLGGQPNSLDYGTNINLGGLPSLGDRCLLSLGDVDEAFESLGPGEQFLSMGDNNSRMDSLSSMGPFPTMGEFSQLPKIPESPPSPNEIESVDSQAGPSSTHDTQDIVGDHDGPLSDSNPNPNAEHDNIVENDCNSDEKVEMDPDIQGQNEPVSNPQLPSTLLSNARSQPVIEIPLREPVRQRPDYILERVLVEEQN